VLGLLLAAALVVGAQDSCDAPPRLQAAELNEQYQNIKTFSSGDVVEYTCRPGYVRNYHVRNTYVCGKYRRWRGLDNFCTPKPCRNPGEPTNGRLVEVDHFTFGSVANFSCDVGYRLVGNAQIKCVVENGIVTWDGNVPFCEPIPCSPPPKIANGEHSGGDTELFTYGTSVTYRCHTVSRGERPLSLVGDASIFCTTIDNLNGVWSKPAPECKEVSCKKPQVEHSKLVSGYRVEYTYGDTVILDCDLHYSLSGSDTAVCQEDGSWKPPLPQCERISCDDPPDVENAVKARLAGNLFPVETVITYECSKGYEFSPGEKTRHITCLPDFTWSEAPQPCEQISCPDPVVKSGTILSFWDRRDKYVSGDRVRVLCDDGYVFKNDQYIVIQCTANGTWNMPVPECVKVPRCPQSVIDHGREVSKTKSDYSIGTQLRMECDEGYVMRGQDSVTCLADGSWDPSLPYCEKACDPPPQITHGVYSNPSSAFFPYGYEVIYECVEGMSLIGAKSIHCTSDDGVNLAWSGPAPECRVVRCPRPVVEHGKMALPQHTFPYGTSVHFYCERGFALHGDAESQCLEDGAWHPPLPTCQPVKCPAPNRRRDLEISPKKREYEVNETLPFSCKRAGYPPEVLTTTCTADGTWMPPLKCETFHACKKVLEIQDTFQCGVPLAELKTLLEVQKLYLEIQKLEKDL
ncbi:C4BPA protein, partial [Penelope pileata]|nr:C4BPA protein [Penelope pileata]